MTNGEDYESSVFINCPFDPVYSNFFKATVFTIHDCGFIARCAKETQDSSKTRIAQILDIIRECKYGIHDICWTELDDEFGLPRFNMPLELGLFLGAKEFGRSNHGEKVCLVLDKEQYRYQKFCSDISGQDISSHEGEVRELITQVRNWLGASTGEMIPTGSIICERYADFKEDLPVITEPYHMKPEEMTFIDFRNVTVNWLEENPLGN